MSRALLGLCALAGTAAAQPATEEPAADAPSTAAPAPAPTATNALTIEGGLEGDTNLQRVETGEGLMTERRGGSVARLGWRVDRRARIFGGAYAAGASMLGRFVTLDEARSETVALFAGDLRWLRPLGERPAALGFGVSGANALGLATDPGARTFATVATEVILALRKDDRAFTLGIGPRYFRYKPDAQFDWWGPGINARLDLTIWEPSSGTKSLELTALAGFEARIYDSVARASACPDDAPPSPECFAPTALLRRDRYQRAGVELTYTSGVIATVGYQVTVIDSNSFGMSLARHRATVSATTELPKQLIGTVLATLQIDRYLDGLVVEKDLQHQEYTNLDDANRSSLQTRIARRVTAAWSLEGRLAIWRDLGGTLDTSYRRELVYFGGVYTK